MYYYIMENRCIEAKWLSECHSVTSGLIKGLRIHSGLILPSLVPCPLGNTTKVFLCFDSAVHLLAILLPLGLAAPENKRHKEYVSFGAEMYVRIDGGMFLRN